MNSLEKKDIIHSIIRKVIIGNNYLIRKDKHSNDVYITFYNENGYNNIDFVLNIENPKIMEKHMDFMLKNNLCSYLNFINFYYKDESMEIFDEQNKKIGYFLRNCDINRSYYLTQINQNEQKNNNNIFNNINNDNINNLNSTIKNNRNLIMNKNVNYITNELQNNNYNNMRNNMNMNINVINSMNNNAFNQNPMNNLLYNMNMMNMNNLINNNSNNFVNANLNMINNMNNNDFNDIRFTNDLNKKIMELEQELNIEKEKNLKIMKELNNEKLEKKNLNEQIKSLIGQINELKFKSSYNKPIESMKPGEKILAVNFMSQDQTIQHYCIPCKNTELFIKLE